MKITIVCVGKIKKQYLVDGIKDYSKRINKFADFNIIEVNDEIAPNNISDNEVNIIMKKEATKIINKLSNNTFIFALTIKGKKYSSLTFANKLDNLTTYGNSNICFIIGGSFGIHQDVISLANSELSFSDFTLPHQLIRLVLCEQIYRSFTINGNITYHK